jgi:hypothetical protein
VKNFFDPLRKEIEEIIAPPKKAMVVSTDPRKTKDPLRTSPIDPLNPSDRATALPEVEGVLRAVPVPVDPPTVELEETEENPSVKEDVTTVSPSTDTAAMLDKDPAAPPRANVVDDVEETGDEIEYENE